MSVPEPEVIEVTKTRIACDGGGAALGHPRVWLQIDPETGYVECGYCDRRYVLKEGAAAAAIEVTGFGKGHHLKLIDGSGYIFRAYHALPPLTRRSDGAPIGAVAGFCNMVWKMVEEAKGDDAPTHVAVIFDHSAAPSATISTRLQGAAPRAARGPAPAVRADPRRDAGLQPALHRDGGLRGRRHHRHLRDAAAAGGRAGDDHLRRQGPDAARGSRHRLVDTLKNRRIGREEVEEKFGVPPEKVIDVQALAGDSVDNVPGAPGIGIKTAAQLIGEYGDLDTLLARAGEIRQPKRRETLLGFADQIRLSRELVTLKRDVDTPVPLEALEVREPDPRRCSAFSARWSSAR
jgi:DNA polymerase I